MIKVTKKELSERNFTPYQIVIEITSEKEHEALQKEIDWVELTANSHTTSFFKKAIHYPVFKELITLIRQHLK